MGMTKQPTLDERWRDVEQAITLAMSMIVTAEASQRTRTQVDEFIGQIGAKP